MKNLLFGFIILHIFVLSLILYAIYMNSIIFWNAVIGIIAGLITALAVAWAVIKFYPDKKINDATFKQHFSDYEKDNERFKQNVSTNFIAFSRKLDVINNKIDNQSNFIARLEGRIEELSKK